MKRIALIVLRTSLAFLRMRDHQLADMPLVLLEQPRALGPLFETQMLVSWRTAQELH